MTKITKLPWMVKIWFKGCREIFAGNNYRKISENEARKLYDELIKGNIAALEEGKGKSKDKRGNILRILQNLESVFTGTYFHYDDAFKQNQNLKKAYQKEQN